MAEWVVCHSRGSSPTGGRGTPAGDRPHKEAHMTPTSGTDRRTVLKTLGATTIGATVLSGTATAQRPDAGRSPNTPDVTIVAEHDHDTGDHRFDVQTDTVPSGWTTIELDNQTSHTHFALLQRIPQPAIDGAADAGMDLLAYWDQEIVNPFQEFMDLLLGKSNTFTGFPDWFGQVLPAGGPGLTTGGHSSKTTQYLDSGKYQVECYVKTADNEFHSYHGMSGLLTVTEATSDDREPRSTLDLTLTNDGLTAPKSVRPGRHAVGVAFVEQTPYSHLLGHDVHLIRLDGETDIGAVNGWMNWMSGSQLIADGTEPTPFLGGVQNIGIDLPRTGYHHVRLTPGEYAWVAEIPDPQSKGFLQTFTVPGQGRGPP